MSGGGGVQCSSVFLSDVDDEKKKKSIPPLTKTIIHSIHYSRVVRILEAPQIFLVVLQDGLLQSH